MARYWYKVLASRYVCCGHSRRTASAWSKRNNRVCSQCRDTREWRGHPYGHRAARQYHDFTKGLVAMKITEKDTCFVKPSDETYDDIKKVVDDIKKGEKAPKVQATEEWVVPKTPLPAEEIEQKVGKRIAKFCSGCKVQFLQDGKVIRAAADVPRVTAKRGAVRSRSKGFIEFCLFCCSTAWKIKTQPDHAINVASTDSGSVFYIAFYISFF
ncbi:uncharacterized protein LOC124292404 [Haliotis rubra]|uniref:uncharacterized protein LOC124292404 n=1 Tax=Haliotis rubra TaxID=36100 RepID=UPI001EE4EF33|nr:uncharacterized protein LOC124292404 [Haliotis rubra]